MDANDKTASALRVYDEIPMEEGDVVLLLDDHLALELEQLADHWSTGIRDSLVASLRDRADTVLMAVARPQRELLDGDHAMWADFREELLGSGVSVLPLIGLRAA